MLIHFPRAVNDELSGRVAQGERVIFRVKLGGPASQRTPRTPRMPRTSSSNRVSATRKLNGIDAQDSSGYTSELIVNCRSFPLRGSCWRVKPPKP